MSGLSVPVLELIMSHVCSKINVIASSLPPLISTRTPDGFFLLMLGIHARFIPWTITNNIGVGAKRDFSI